MRKYLFLCLISIITYTISSEHIVINEIYFDPILDETDNEFIEIYNSGPSNVNLTNWSLTDNDGICDIIFPEFILPSDAYLVVFTGKGVDELNFTDNVGYLYMNKSISNWNNDGDDILLLNGSNYPIDYVSYYEEGKDSSAIDPCPDKLSWDKNITDLLEGRSLSLIPNGIESDSYNDWKLLSPSLGAKNDFGDPPDQYESKILIEEIYYYPYPNRNNEYIKITNQANKSVNISFWYVTNLDNILQIPASTSLDSNGSIYITEEGQSFYEDMGFFPDFEYVDTSDEIPQAEFRSWVRMSNSGEVVILEDEYGYIIDEVVYGINYTSDGWKSEPIPLVESGQILKRNKNGFGSIDTDTYQDWISNRMYKIGQSNLTSKTFEFSGEVRTFVSPDSSFSCIVDEINKAKETIYLCVYQLESYYIADALIDAINRGVSVYIFLEGGPVGGISDSEKYLNQLLSDAGANIRFMVLDYDLEVYPRYRYIHAKYCVIDNESLILTTENWKNTGIPTDPSFGNRGWGIVVKNTDISNYFANLFFLDFNPKKHDSYPFNESHYKYGAPDINFSFNYTIPTDNYRPIFNVSEISSEFRITTVLSPDNTLDENNPIISLINSANESIYIEQLSCDISWSDDDTYLDNLYLKAAIDAARRGVEVKVILESRYVNIYDSYPDNYDVVLYLNELADQENLNLEAKLVSLFSISKVHTKGMIVDRKYVLISSINWVRCSVQENREVGLIIENEEVANYYYKVFVCDWYDNASIIYKEKSDASDEFSSSDLAYLISISTLAMFGSVIFLIKKIGFGI